MWPLIYITWLTWPLDINNQLIILHWVYTLQWGCHVSSSQLDAPVEILKKAIVTSGRCPGGPKWRRPSWVTSSRWWRNFFQDIATYTHWVYFIRIKNIIILLILVYKVNAETLVGSEWLRQHTLIPCGEAPLTQIGNSSCQDFYFVYT